MCSPQRNSGKKTSGDVSDELLPVPPKVDRLLKVDRKYPPCRKLTDFPNVDCLKSLMQKDCLIHQILER